MKLDEKTKRELLVQLLQHKKPPISFSEIAPKNDETPIAIVGLSGRYPMADSLEQFWVNLCEGRDCITDVPTDRWRCEDFAREPDDAKDFSKRRGGFTADVDKFDPSFFGISPREAERMDPQERLFLQTAWHTLEDAGYTPEQLNRKDGKVGVFVGAMNSNYSIWGASLWKDNQKSDRAYPCNAAFWSIANRVSYYFNLTGPSLAIDSACSSSLTAIHLACQSLRRDECSAAIAGGVNLILHPAQLDALSRMNMLSRSGHCHSFGKDADGFADGEGVGAVLLKPLPRALEDGDHIYATIRGSSINAGGKTSGFTVPNLNSQADLISTVIRQSNIDARQISYVEAHGTGTSLGDPIEVRGLTKAFNQFTNARQFCALGSVKSNIGHLEAAAGISGLTKVLLQMKHETLVPSLHADQENEYIEFEKSPFFLQKSLSRWAPGDSKIAGISSFGAGGANAHLILESFDSPAAISTAAPQPCLILLSTANQQQLDRYAQQLLAFLKHATNTASINLLDMAYTLCVGRASMPTRMALVVSEVEELKDKLTRCLNGEKNIEGFFEGTAGSRQESRNVEADEIDPSDLDILAKQWVVGEIDKPEVLFKGLSVRRLSLPVYPFLKERYWISHEKNTELVVPVTEPVDNAPHTVATPPLTQEGTLYLTPYWENAPLMESSSRQDNASILVFGNRDQDFAAFEKAFLATGENRKVIYALTDGVCSDAPANSNVVSANNKNEIAAVLSSLESQESPLDSIVFAWPRPQTDELYTPIRSLTQLCQLLVEYKLDRKVKLLVWSTDNGNQTDLLGNACAGFLKSFKAERQSPFVKHVVFESVAEHSLPFQLQALAQELLEEKASHVVIRYVQGQRMAEQLQFLSPAPVSPATALFKPGGTYLITGGAGGLGKIFAKRIAELGNVNLILVGRSPIDEDKKSLVSSLTNHGNEVVYLSCDVTSPGDTKALFEKIISRFHALNGIIHSAGVVKDCLLGNKAWHDFQTVLDPKIKAINCLDAESAKLSLEFFMAFSSVSAVLGNVGQCDYAYGNSYLDSFIFWRNRQVDLGNRAGRSLSINWPIWEEGGMHIHPQVLKGIKERLGVIPLSTADGISAMDRIATMTSPQVMPIYGIQEQIVRFLNTTNLTKTSLTEVTAARPVVRPSFATPATPQLSQFLQQTLRQITSVILDLTEDRIDADQIFHDFGFDSITLQELAGHLKRRLAVDVSPAIFFQENTLNKVSSYLIAECHQQITEAMQKMTTSTHDVSAKEHAPPETNTVLPAPQTSNGRMPSRCSSVKEDIAVIGMSGIFPDAEDLEVFWNNLITGVDPITEIPPQRWIWQDYYGDTFGAANKMNSKWGGFIPDVDQFDYGFFGLSENEALYMDPQQRLFLQTVWKTIEDGGYQVSALKKETVGVFVGVEFCDYKDLLDQLGEYKAEMAIGNAPNMTANRVSFYFDFNGPSEAIDTACSSSLIAVNRAVRSIQSGESSMAIAGGVSLTLSPKTMIGTSQLNIYSPDGRCKTLDKNANGYVKGEGIGAILLKPLSRAIEDGDNIIGLIKGCATNHGGRSNSITAPNPVAQARLLVNAYQDAGIDPERISYLEMHGTGTQLGDPIEIEGMKSAFHKLAQATGKTLRKQGYCGIGSVKTNIGHLEPAAGIAGLIKILLAMREEQLPANLHFEELNPLIKLEETPFYVVDKAQQWKRQTDDNGFPLPYVAGISSFGFGGSNAHVVIEEWRKNASSSSSVSNPMAFILSARNKDRLRAYATTLLSFAEKAEDKGISLADTTYTLQIGRQAMNERLAFVVHDWQECIANLRSYLADTSGKVAYQGNIIDTSAMVRDLLDAELQAFIVQRRNIELLAKYWVLGVEVNWNVLYQDQQSRRIPLPTYPFAKTRCWPVADNQAVNVRQTVIANREKQSLDELEQLEPECRENTDNSQVNRRIVDKIARITGRKPEDIQLTAHLSADLNLDSIKMMGLVNELVSDLPAEQIQHFNQLGMNTIVGRAQTVAGLIDVFAYSDAESAKGDEPAAFAPLTDRSIVSQDSSPVDKTVKLLNAQTLFLPAYFLTKSSSLCSYLEIKGELDLDRANECWRKLIDRHPSLRIRFHWPSKPKATFADVSAEFVDSFTVPSITVTDISPLSIADQNSAIGRVFEAQLNRQWDLAQWPLHEFSIIKKSEQDFILLWSNEHIVSDGLSNQQALKEFLQLYQALTDGVELSPANTASDQAYRHMVQTMNSYQNQQEDEAYIRFNQQHTGTYCFNPERKSPNVASAHFVNRSRRLSTDQTKALIELTKTSRFSLNSLLIAAFLKALSAHDQTQQQFILQVPTSGRIYPNVEIADAIGCFAQNLSLSFARVNDGDALESTLERVQSTIENALLQGVDNAQTRQLGAMIQQMPLSEDNTLPQHYVAMLRENIKSNLYFPYTGHTQIEANYGGLQVTQYAAGTSNSPGAIDLLQEIFQDSLHIFCNYDANCFSAELIEQLIDRYIETLKTFSEVRTVLPDKQPLETNLVEHDDLTQLVKIAEGIGHITIGPEDLSKDLEADLGFDSLDRIRLVTQLDQLQAGPINRAGLAKCRSLSEMAKLLMCDAKTAAPVVMSPATRSFSPSGQNDTIPADLTQKDLPISMIVEQCKQSPELTAVTHYNGASITYRELDEQSNQIAHRLIASGIGRGDYVGLLTNRGPLMLTGIIAILKAGAAYVPIDPILPAGRIRYILNHARIRTLLTEPDLVPLLQQLSGDVEHTNATRHLENIILLTGTDDQQYNLQKDWHVTPANSWQAESTRQPNMDIQPTDDMVVLFTSGSTGNPKGVTLNHVGYANRLQWHQKMFQLQTGEKVAQKTSCCFDVSLWELFWPLMYGGTVCAVEKQTVSNPWEFADWIEQEGINIAHFVPSMFTEFANSIFADHRQFASLRWLIFSGEALPTAIMQKWIDHQGLQIGLCNLYGPTEASIDVTYHIIDKRPVDGEPIPIGKAVDNTYLLILDKEGKPAPKGEAGELCIGGVQLAKGYLYEPELTEKAFIPNPVSEIPGDKIYRTGDLAVERDNGSFDYHGRLDSQVKLRGYRIELGEIENVVCGYPAINEAAALVVNRGGKDKLALWYSGTKTDPAEIKAFVGKHCPDYMVPQLIFYQDCLPKNPNGKLDRKVLLKQLDETTQSDRENKQTANSSKQLTLPVGPAQKWIFSYFEPPYQWWGYSRLQFNNSFDADVFRKSIDALIGRHDALRTTFSYLDGKWIQTVLPHAPAVDIQRFDCSEQTEMDREQSIRQLIGKLASQLDYGQWPLCRFAIVKTGHDTHDVIWVSHHLIADMISGQILSDELWKLYTAIKTGADTTSMVSAAAVSYSDYIEEFQRNHNDQTVARFVSYWSKYAGHRQRIGIPFDHRLGENIESSEQQLVVPLPKDTIDCLQREACQYFDASFYHVLVAPLYKLLSSMLNRSWVVVSHKLNGRNAHVSARNYFQSIGNFAINVPLGIFVKEQELFAGLVSALKNEISALPLGGASYDWISDQLPSEIYPDNKLTSIRVNYLGDITSTVIRSNSKDQVQVNQRLAPPEQQRTSLMEFFFYIENQQTFLIISYSSNFYKKETINKLASGYLTQLDNLMSEMTSELIQVN
ncbi:MAG: amino acid adenylation domain-containing protein [Gammaproteobacteria bacterium]